MIYCILEFRSNNGSHKHFTIFISKVKRDRHRLLESSLFTKSSSSLQRIYGNHSKNAQFFVSIGVAQSRIKWALAAPKASWSALIQLFCDFTAPTVDKILEISCTPFFRLFLKFRSITSNLATEVQFRSALASRRAGNILATSLGAVRWELATRPHA